MDPSTLLAAGTELGGSVCTCTLLGPEGPDVLDLRIGPDESSGPFLVGHNSAGGEGTARTLRTTQWTRASLQDDPLGLFCVDDLKDH